RRRWFFVRRRTVWPRRWLWCVVFISPLLWLMSRCGLGCRCARRSVPSGSAVHAGLIVVRSEHEGVGVAGPEESGNAFLYAHGEAERGGCCCPLFVAAVGVVGLKRDGLVVTGGGVLGGALDFGGDADAHRAGSPCVVPCSWCHWSIRSVHRCGRPAVTARVMHSSRVAWICMCCAPMSWSA